MSTAQLGFPDGSVVKNLPASGSYEVDSWVRKIPWSRKLQPTPLGNPIVHGKSHGQRSLAGYSPCGCKELGMTEQLSTQTRIVRDRSPGLQHKLLGNFWLSERRWDNTRKDFWEVNAVVYWALVWGELKQQDTGHDLKRVCKILLTWWPAQKPNSEAICWDLIMLSLYEITEWVSNIQPGAGRTQDSKVFTLEGVYSSLHG